MLKGLCGTRGQLERRENPQEQVGLTVLYHLDMGFQRKSWVLISSLLPLGKLPKLSNLKFCAGLIGIINTYWKY